MISKYDAIIEGLAIFKKYGDDGTDFSAEHDVIRAGLDCREISAEDLQRLKELGWHPDTEYDDFYKFV